MRIAFLNDGLYRYATADTGAVGGSERQQWLLARALASRNWSVHVGIHHGLPRGEARTIGGVEFRGIRRGQCLLDWYRYLSMIRPDWLYWRGATHLLGPLVQIARAAGTRTIFAAAFDTDVRPAVALASRQRWWPLYAWGLSGASRIFAQHSGQVEGLPTRWRSKTFVVRSISGSADCAPHVNRQPYVAWVGMLRQPKRPDLLADIAERMPAVPFRVCGGSSMHRSPAGYGDHIMKRLRALPNVDVQGQVPPAQAETVIAGAAALLCTSDEEGFPNTFLQAWSHGTPVVSLTIDPDAVIKRFDLGGVVGTVESAREYLTALLSSPEGRQAIALRALEYVAAHHYEEPVLQGFRHAVVQSQN